ATDVGLAQDGRSTIRKSVTVPAQGVASVLVPLNGLGHVITARLDAHDALEIDNARMTIVPPLERVRVALSGGPSLFLQKALSVNAAVTVEPNAGSPDDVVCDGCPQVPDGRSGVLFVPAAGAFSQSTRLTVTRANHPLVRSVDFSGLFATPLSLPAPPNDAEIVVRAGDSPVLAAYERNGRRFVELRVDLNRPDFALAPAFPVLMANAVEWLAARDRNRREVTSGDPVQWLLSPEAANGPSVVGPGGAAVPAAVTNGRLTIAATDIPGEYHVRSRGGD